MIDKIRDVGKQTFLYGLGSIINRLLGFILIPVYQCYIPIGDFGNLAYFETIILFLTALLNFGIAPAHQRFFYSEHEKKTYGIYLFNNFFGCLFLASMAILPVIIFSGEVASIVCKSASQSTNLIISLLIVVTEVIYIIPLQVLQYEQKPLQYLIFNIIKLVFTFSLTIFLVLQYTMGIEGILYARLAGSLTAVIIAFFVVILPRITVKINLKSINQSIVFGFTYVLSTIGLTLFMISDRFMLEWFSTNVQLGKYSFGFKIANFINLIFVQTIGMSYFPSVMRNETLKNNTRYYRKMLTYYCFIIAILILGFLFFYQDILWIVGRNKEYWEGLKVVPILSLSFMVMGMNYFVGVGLFLKNQTKYYLIPSLSALSVNILLNIWLVPSLGMMGAAYSVLVAQIIYMGLLALLSGKQMKITFEWNKIIQVYILAVIIFLFVQYCDIRNFFLITALKLIMLALFPIILYKFNFFEKIEIQRIKDFVIKSLGRIKL
jgi:O-antigen/teichoic acid export membrane protein